MNKWQKNKNKSEVASVQISDWAALTDNWNSMVAYKDSDEMKAILNKLRRNKTNQ